MQARSWRRFRAAEAVPERNGRIRVVSTTTPSAQETATPAFGRVLLKLSGEALMGEVGRRGRERFE